MAEVMVRFQVPNTLTFGGFVMAPEQDAPEWIAYFEAGGLKAWVHKEATHE